MVIPFFLHFISKSLKDFLDFEELVHRHRCIFSGQRPSSLYSSKALRILDEWNISLSFGRRGEDVFLGEGWGLRWLWCFCFGSSKCFFSIAWGRWPVNWLHTLLFFCKKWVSDMWFNYFEAFHFPAHDRKAYAAKNYTTAEPGYPISNLISGFGCNSLGPQMSETLVMVLWLFFWDVWSIFVQYGLQWFIEGVHFESYECRNCSEIYFGTICPIAAI